MINSADFLNYRTLVTLEFWIKQEKILLLFGCFSLLHVLNPDFLCLFYLLLFINFQEKKIPPTFFFRTPVIFGTLE